MSEREDFRAVRGVLVAFTVGVAGAVTFMVFYALNGNTQWLGLSLALAFGGIGYGLTAWAHRLMPQAGEIELREKMQVPGEEEAAAAAYFEGRTAGVGRRRLLGGALAAALGSTGIALLFPFRSFGPRPADLFRRTDFAKVHHPRLVTKTGTPVHRDDLPIGGFLTVFPEGYVGSADAQTALIRIDPDLRLLPPTREDWVVEGYIAYSKICTHAGCPVGEYQVEYHSLFCPCHQSAFEVLNGGRPRLGPAARPLPQLALGIDDAGFLIALGDYTEPVGPGWWTRPQAGPRG